MRFVERFARRIALHDTRHDQFGGFERRETLTAAQALAAAAHLLALAGSRESMTLVSSKRRTDSTPDGPALACCPAARSARAQPYTGKRRQISFDRRACLCDDGFVVRVGRARPLSSGELRDLRFLEATRRDRGRADADAAGDHRRARIVRHRVLVDRDVSTAERGVRFLARHVLVGQVDQEQMVVGAAGDDLDSRVAGRPLHIARAFATTCLW